MNKVVYKSQRLDFQSQNSTTHYPSQPQIWRFLNSSWKTVTQVFANWRERKDGQIKGCKRSCIPILKSTIQQGFIRPFSCFRFVAWTCLRENIDTNFHCLETWVSEKKKTNDKQRDEYEYEATVWFSIP